MQHGFLRKSKQEALPNAIFGDEIRNWTSLHEAASSGDDRSLEKLLAGNVDRMSKESTYGNTALHEAASRGFSRCVKLICAPPTLNKSASSKEKNKIKNSVAYTIEALHNSTLSIRNNEGLSALHLAVQNGHNQSCRELLLAGSDPDVQNNYGDTPLHTACRYGHAGVTRILLSASCDPNKANLNGDTALHITCAMGRRKLTRILLEADALLNIRNSQGETARDIAIRKSYSEILEILSSPKRIRNRKEKPEGSGDGGQKKTTEQTEPVNIISWSPYGCHYFPDPRAFPSPKLETLPKEPLKPGEQYFLDLAGNIHKGPISVGNTCYCGPFFRHIENKLNCNRRSLKKYVNKTKERLGHKVQALAMKTNDQIEQLTRTMIADRIRCENKRIYLNEYLRRGERLRSTLDNQSLKNSLVERTLSRSRSLEELDKLQFNNNLPNSRSFDALESGEALVMVHNANDDEESDDKEELSEQLNDIGSGIIGGGTTALSNQMLKQSKLDELKLDFFKVSERLGDLLEKTSLIMERDNEREDAPTSRFDFPKASIQSASKNHTVEASPQDKSVMGSPNSAKYAYPSIISRRYPNSSETSNPSQHSNSWDCEASPTGSQPQQDLYKYYCGVQRNEVLQNVIRALRKDDATATQDREEVVDLNEYEHLCEDKVQYKDIKHLARPAALEMDAGFEHCVNHNGPVYATRVMPISLAEHSHEKTDPLTDRLTTAQQFQMIPLKLPEIKPLYDSQRQIAVATATAVGGEPNVNGTMEKVEIRNCEIKSLKKSSVGQVKSLVAQLQSKINLTKGGNMQHDESACSTSAGLDIPTNERTSLGSFHLNAVGDISDGAYDSQTVDASPYTSPQLWLHGQHHIPKDAYFHDLPHKPRYPLHRAPMSPNHTAAHSTIAAGLEVEDLANAPASTSSQLYRVSQRLYPTMFAQNANLLRPTSIQEEDQPPELFNVKNISSLV